MTIEDEIKRRRITEPGQLVGKTIASTWDSQDTIAIRFDDGTYVVLEAEDDRYDESADINWNGTVEAWLLAQIGVITEDQREELERRAEEIHAALERDRKWRTFELLKAEFEKRTDAPTGG